MNVAGRSPRSGYVRARRRVRHYAAGTALAMAAVLASRLVGPLVEPDRVSLPLLLAAVMVSAWYGGLGPGLLTTAIAIASKLYFIVPPAGSFAIDSVATALHVIVAVLVAILISSLTDALHRAEAANRHLADEERVARAEAEAANRAKDVFLAKISHELRTPLQATRSWTEVLARSGPEDRAFRETLDAVRGAIARQASLIDELLTVSEIVAGKVRLRMEPVMLGPVIEAAVHTATAAARAPQPAVRLALDPSAGPVLGDRARLEQVVCNLMSNALKFTPPQGRVDVRLDHDRRHARLVVADTGRGIPEAMLSRLFEEFWQVDSRETGSVGLGLGLAIVRQLVQMHGGTVHGVSPGPGGGATFVVQLPLAEQDAVPAAAHAAAGCDAGEAAS